MVNTELPSNDAAAFFCSSLGSSLVLVAGLSAIAFDNLSDNFSASSMFFFGLLSGHQSTMRHINATNTISQNHHGSTTALLKKSVSILFCFFCFIVFVSYNLILYFFISTLISIPTISAILCSIDFAVLGGNSLCNQTVIHNSHFLYLLWLQIWRSNTKPKSWSILIICSYLSGIYFIIEV